MKKRIAIDMDEVIADAVAKLVMCYNRDFEENLTVHELKGSRFHEYVRKKHDFDPENYLRDPGFFGDLAVMPDCQEVIRLLQEHYEIFIATAAMEVPTSFAAKYEWLREHFPFISPMNVVFCGDKGILSADYLIDDNVRHFKRFRGQGILFSAPHNLDETDYPRVNNWLEVGSFFLDSHGF